MWPGHWERAARTGRLPVAPLAAPPVAGDATGWPSRAFTGSRRAVF